ncbi:MAG: CBS domain-containing protein [Acidobacteria bacterium]|nr:CBS domain-containing protein [Acidobacteriota bacterium]
MRERNDIQNEGSNPTMQQGSETRSADMVRKAMTSNPATCSENDTVIRAAELMVEHDCGAIPIVEGRTVKGMITDRDIVARVVAKRADPGDKRVSEVMSEGVQTIREDESLERAFEMMSQHKVRRLPVVNSNGELTGMLAQADLALDTKQDSRLADTVEEISEPNRSTRA